MHPTLVCTRTKRYPLHTSNSIDGLLLHSIPPKLLGSLRLLTTLQHQRGRSRTPWWLLRIISQFNPELLLTQLWRM